MDPKYIHMKQFCVGNILFHILWLWLITYFDDICEYEISNVYNGNVT